MAFVIVMFSFFNSSIISAKYVKDDVPKELIMPGDGISAMFDKFKKVDNRKIVTSNKRYLVCAKKRVERYQSENWYMIKLKGRVGVADSNLAKNTVISMIRGEVSFNDYRKDQLNTDRVMVIEKIADNELLNRFDNFLEKKGTNLSYKKRVFQGFPGLIE